MGSEVTEKKDLIKYSKELLIDYKVTKTVEVDKEPYKNKKLLSGMWRK